MSCACENSGTNYNLCAQRNTDFTWDFTLTYKSTGLPVDLTGNTFRFLAKRNKDDPDVDAVFDKTNGNGITLTPLLGRFSMLIPEAEINAVDVSSLFQSMTRTIAGVERPFTYGTMSIGEDFL